MRSVMAFVSTLLISLCALAGGGGGGGVLISSLMNQTGMVFLASEGDSHVVFDVIEPSKGAIDYQRIVLPVAEVSPESSLAKALLESKITGDWVPVHLDLEH
jgi:hypothetical protein